MRRISGDILIPSLVLLILVAGLGTAWFLVESREREAIRVQMPDMGGRELATRLKADHPHIPIVFTSGYDVESMGIGSASDPAEMHVSKPYSTRELIRVIRRAMARGGAMN